MGHVEQQFDQAFRQRRVLITGGLGFIGSNLARRLVGFGADVTIVDSMVPEYGGNMFNVAEIEDRLKIHISDVRDPQGMQVLIQGQDYLFNLAGQTSHMDSMKDPYVDLEINCQAQLSILEACRHYNPSVSLVFASTRQVYGKPKNLPVDENHLLQPVDVNGINKMAGEWYHILYNNVYGIRACALRLTNTYGPRMRIKDDRQTFLGIWIKLLLEGKPFEVWGGEQLRDFTYVDDAVDALMLAVSDARAAGKVFNVGGEKPVSLADLAAVLIAANDDHGQYAMRQFPDERKRIDIGHYYADDRLIRDTLGWKPNCSLEQGLRQTLSYYRKNLDNYL